MKKFFSIIILSALVIGMFLKPVSVYAYSTDLNSYIDDDDVTVEEAKEYVGHTLLGLALASGAELVVPGSGATVAEITDQIWDVIDFSDELYQWCKEMSRKWDEGEINWQDVTGGVISEEIVRVNHLSPVELALQVLLTNWNNNSSEIETYPETNYLPYIELINGKSFNYQYLLTDNWFTTLSASNIPNNQGHISFNRSPSTCSYLTASSSRPTIDSWNNSGQSSRYVAGFAQNKYLIGTCYPFDIVSIYINNIDNSYQLTCSTLNPVSLLHNQYQGNAYRFNAYYDTSSNQITSFGGMQYSAPSVSWQSSANTLEDAFKIVAMSWRNVNIYVDGLPWSIVTAPPDPIQLGGNTYITDTNTPVYYDFPEGTKFNPNILASILRQLIDLNNTGNAVVIQIDDILESFTDEYGVTAQYVVNIVRNDYDNLISEQYGNKQVRVQFPEELKPYSEKVTYVMNNFGDDLIPQDLLTIICCGGILLLIGFLINRMLE